MAKEYRTRQLDLFTIAPNSSDIRSKQVRDLCAWGWFNISNHKRQSLKHSQGDYFIEVSAASEKGIATYHDNDILIFLTSHLVHSINQGGCWGRTIFFSANEFFNFTDRAAKGGYRYELIWDSLTRLNETFIHTNIPMGGDIIRESRWNLLPTVEREKSKKTGKTLGFVVEIASEIYRSIKQDVPQVLTLHNDYFSIRSGFVKWLYLYARRCCGTDGREWIATEATLRSMSGSTSSIVEFRRMLKTAMDADLLLDYEMKPAFLGSERAIAFRRKRLAIPKMFKQTLVIE